VVDQCKVRTVELMHGVMLATLMETGPALTLVCFNSSFIMQLYIIYIYILYDLK